MSVLEGPLNIKKQARESSKSSAFRRALDAGRTIIVNQQSTAAETEADDERRRGVLEGLLKHALSDDKGLEIPEASRSPIQLGLANILQSKDAMIALSKRWHAIRLEGNHSAHTIQSLSRFQEQLDKNKDHPLALESRKAMKVLARFFTDLHSLSPPVTSPV